MNKPNHAPLTDDECHALTDSQGTPEVLAVLRQRLATDPDGQCRLTQWHHQRDALQKLYTEVLDDAVPPALAQAALKTGVAHETATHTLRLGGMVASVVLAFAAGWLANSSWQSTGAIDAAAPKLARAKLEHDFVRQASLAHNVYVPEVRHPVEVTALEQAHLVQWLSKRLSKPLKVPDLTAQGFELVGGRLLPGDTGARAQFMFQNAAGGRVTLYLGTLTVPAKAKPFSGQETAFRYEPQAGVPSFYWVDHGFGYALTGQLPRDALMKLAQVVYQQL
ncbi:MAG: anti-sigma factor [Rhodoferax sp.]|uniref:anti-sigma factor family protein n=1 Tax=Rhodoferax sp. TaxID=50421 RepID=UPI00262DD8AE|nr:anti-sigma factor [Rhodoferax sp.]MDD2879195.1 anti-sigma factor [Rhodoferax sp.]